MMLSPITAVFLFCALLSVLPAVLFGILAAAEPRRVGGGLSRDRRRQFGMLAVFVFFLALAAVTFVMTRVS